MTHSLPVTPRGHPPVLKGAVAPVTQQRSRQELQKGLVKLKVHSTEMFSFLGRLKRKTKVFSMIRTDGGKKKEQLKSEPRDFLQEDPRSRGFRDHLQGFVSERPSGFTAKAWRVESAHLGFRLTFKFLECQLSSGSKMGKIKSVALLLSNTSFIERF